MAARKRKSFSKLLFTTFCFIAVLFVAAEAMAQVLEEQVLFSLRHQVPVPEPPADILDQYVTDRNAAIALGKALFWDVQLGSDGFTACASCHFNAGADIRVTNQVSPGLLGGDTQFGNSAVGTPGHSELVPNHTLTAADFPLHKRENPTALVPRPGFFGVVGPQDLAAELLGIVRDTNDVVSSQGVHAGEFLGLRPRNNPAEVGELSPTDEFGFQVTLGRGTPKTVRRVEPRNAPTVINAVFNLEQFWDGRASLIFNGVNPFGFRDTGSTLKKLVNGSLVDTEVRIPNASLASQAVGPPLSDHEMSLSGRTFPMIGRKLLSAKPLARQHVHPEDSVLGQFSPARHTPGRVIPPRVLAGRVVGGRVIPDRISGPKGLKSSPYPNYAEMVKAAFHPDWWGSSELIPVGGDQYTQMEYNFSLFFGLALQLYQATLISDDTPFDRFQEVFLGAVDPQNPEPDRTHPNWNALTPQELLGYDIFFGTNWSGSNPVRIGDPPGKEGGVSGRCSDCHIQPELTNAAFRLALVVNGVPTRLVEFMTLVNGGFAAYDNGFYNVGARPTTEDLARAFRAPENLGVTVTGEQFPLSYTELAILKIAGMLPAKVAAWVPTQNLSGLPIAVKGAFKAPSLRNLEFTGPYFHSGSEATLRHVVDFYTRGGNFPVTNFENLDVGISGIPGLDPTQATTDSERAVVEERIQALVAFLANGLSDDRVRFERAPFDHPQLIVPHGARDRNPRQEMKMTIPAVGWKGRLAPIPRFLGLDPQTP